MKNKTRETLKDIKVIETLPEITKYHHVNIPGSIDPSSVRQLDHLVRVSWKIDELSPYEERLIAYHVKARLGVMGNLRLPAAKIVYMKGNKKYTIYSNTLLLPAKKWLKI